jgi:arsenite methyltransferase
MSNESSIKPNYGFDAPNLNKIFFGLGLMSLLINFAIQFIPQNLLSQTSLFYFVINNITILAAVYLLFMGCLMVYYSKIQKIQDAKNYLSLIKLKGDEKILDIGCGRGLMLIESAKMLTSGKAFGIDIWSNEDQASNTYGATVKNGEIAGVNHKIELQTCDMRVLNFEDNSFDLVVSSWAIHNIKEKPERQKALSEIIRVLKPSGQIVISDIENQKEYVDFFVANGMIVEGINNKLRDIFLKTVSFGSFSPYAIIGTKK